MDDKDKKRKILGFLKKHQGEYYGARKIDKVLGFDWGHNNYPTHKLLLELKRDGFLKQKYRYGFKLKGT